VKILRQMSTPVREKTCLFTPKCVLFNLVSLTTLVIRAYSRLWSWRVRMFFVKSINALSFVCFAAMVLSNGGLRADASPDAILRRQLPFPETIRLPDSDLSERQKVTHLFNRMAFGPRPG